MRVEATRHPDDEDGSMAEQIEAFLVECCAETGDGSCVATGRLYSLYLYWCYLDRCPPLTRGRFDRYLTRTRGPRLRHEGELHFQGIVPAGPIVPEFIVVIEGASLWDRSALPPGFGALPFKHPN